MKQTLRSLKKRAAMLAKRRLYGERGEPYKVLGHELHFPIGRRPVKFDLIHSHDRLAREEAMTLALLLSWLREGDIALDIGAHAGLYSALMAVRCGQSGRVIAFEPDPHAVRLFNETFALNPDLKKPELETVACSDQTGTAQFFASCGDSRSSFVHGRPDGAELIEVTTIRIDDFLKKNAIKPRLIKIDVEGAEVCVLRGAERLLASGCMIICELHPFAWPRFGTSLDDLVALAEKTNRTFRYVGHSHPISGEAVYGLAVMER
jgi:FkbM family methyltransferase